MKSGDDNRQHAEGNQPQYGNYANIHWRAVKTSDLRMHPYFMQLPHPADVIVDSIRSLGLYRQGSWQWDALHTGRMTTSKVACCLGFYESYAAKELDIPRSLQSHNRAVFAWEQLRCKSPSSWGFLSTRSAGIEMNSPKTEQDSLQHDLNIWWQRSAEDVSSSSSTGPASTSVSSSFPFE